MVTLGVTFKGQRGINMRKIRKALIWLGVALVVLPVSPVVALGLVALGLWPG